MTALAPRQRHGAHTLDALVDAAIDGDERAWESICDQFLPQVRAVANARLRDAHAAEDVVQETLVTAWTRLHQVRDAARLGPWLKTIAANLAIDHVRRQRRTAPIEAAHRTPAPGPSHDEVVVAAEEAEVLHGHLDQLRDVDRRALWQRDAVGVPVGELAAELGMTAGSVRVLLTRARKRVRDGYGLVAAPLVGLLERLRQRTVGLGDAIPVAVAAPAVVVAVAAGVVGISSTSDGSAAMAVGPAPAAPAASVAPAPTTPEPTTPPSPPTDVAPATAPSAAPASAPSEPAAAPAEEPAPAVTVGSASAGFDREVPTEDEQDSQAEAPAGPVEGVELYLEETGIGGGAEDCVICED